MKTREITQIALFSAIGFVFYAITAPFIDAALPLTGCLIRPMIFFNVSIISIPFQKKSTHIYRFA